MDVTDEKRLRRALGAEELAALIRAAEEGSEYRSVSGALRSLVWRTLASTGLRVGELQAARVQDLDLRGVRGPTLKVRAAVSKNRRDAFLPLPPELAAELEPFAGKIATAPLLPLPANFAAKATRFLRCDLARARVVD